MADGHGGSRTPSSPAPVSGPGRLARRTDGGPQQTQAQMTGLPYGENADYMDIQSSAPLAAAPSVSNARSRNTVPTGQAGAAATPLFSPTQRPDEPVTAGAPFGPGAGPTTLPDLSAQDAQQIKSYMPALLRAANAPGAPASFVRFVQYLRGM